MATKFLDKIGLSYFCNKIKAWCNATFAAITHSHTSNTINAMTGYSKPNSSGAITTSDTLNQALGKLEVKIDNVASINNVTNITVDYSSEAVSDNDSTGAELIEDTSSEVLQQLSTIFSDDSVSSYSSKYFIYDGTTLLSHFSSDPSSWNTRVSVEINKYDDYWTIKAEPTVKSISYSQYSVDDHRMSFGLHTIDVTSDNSPFFVRITYNSDGSNISFSSYTIYKKDSVTKNITKLLITKSNNTSTYLELPYIGATESLSSTPGLVPCATASQRNKVLTGKGTWDAANSLINMAGYSKPSVSSAITVSDSLNDAIGKLEAKVDAVDDSNYVHKTDTEVIDGEKTFKGVYDRSDTVSGILIRHPKLTRGDSLSSIHYWQIALCDKDGVEWAPNGVHGRCGNLLLTYDTQGNSYIRITAYKNTANNATEAALVAGVLSDGTTYATAPQTSTSRTDRSDIVTRGFLEDKGYITSSESITGNAETATKLATARTINGVSFDGSANITIADSTKVAKAGDTMTGGLTITNSKTLVLKHTGITRGTAPSSNVYPFFVEFKDNADKTLGGLYYTYTTDKVAKTYLMCYQGTTNANTWNSIGVGYNASSNVFTWAPTPATSSNDTNIATTAFVKAQGYITSSGSITGNAATATKLGTSNVGASNNPIYLNAGVPTATGLTLAKTIQVGVGAGAYSDMLQTLQSDNNNYRSCTIRCENGNGYNTITLSAHDEKNSAPSGIYVKNTNGTVTAGGPHPAADANDDRLATTKWVKDRGYLTSHASLSKTDSGSGNAVTAISVSGHAITVTKGSTFLTSHQSLANYVTLDSAQTISATKTFSANQKFNGGIERWGDNAHIKIFNTGLATYSTQPSADKSGSLGLHANDSNTLASFGVIQYKDAATDRAAYVRCYTSGSNSSYVSVNLNSGSKTFFPGVTKQLSLGRSDRLWTVVYAQTGSINTSDEREKQAIEIIPNSVLDAWEEISWKQFKLNNSVEEKGFDKARLHTGLIAQQIDTIFKNHNLDISKYGLFCYDEWGESPAERNDDDEIVSEPLPPGNQYSLRYEEALCVEAAYQRRKNKILENRISELETQVQSMLQILKNFKGA